MSCGSSTFIGVVKIGRKQAFEKRRLKKLSSSKYGEKDKRKRKNHFSRIDKRAEDADRGRMNQERFHSLFAQDKLRLFREEFPMEYFEYFVSVELPTIDQDRFQGCDGWVHLQGGFRLPIQIKSSSLGVLKFKERYGEDHLHILIVVNKHRTDEMILGEFFRRLRHRLSELEWDPWTPC